MTQPGDCTFNRLGVLSCTGFKVTNKSSDFESNFTITPLSGTTTKDLIIEGNLAMPRSQFLVKFDANSITLTKNFSANFYTVLLLQSTDAYGTSFSNNVILDKEATFNGTANIAFLMPDTTSQKTVDFSLTAMALTESNYFGTLDLLIPANIDINGVFKLAGSTGPGGVILLDRANTTVGASHVNLTNRSAVGVKYDLDFQKKVQDVHLTLNGFYLNSDLLDTLFKSLNKSSNSLCLSNTTLTYKDEIVEQNFLGTFYTDTKANCDHLAMGKKCVIDSRAASLCTRNPAPRARNDTSDGNHHPSGPHHGLPVWAIVLIVLAIVGVIAAIGIVFLTRRQKSSTRSKEESNNNDEEVTVVEASPETSAKKVVGL